MIEFSELLGLVWPKATPPRPAEDIELMHAFGRVLAQDVYAPFDVPPHDNSGMDGYAIHFNSFEEGRAYSVSQRIAAGDSPLPLQANTVARIFTGAPIPPGSSTVIMQEQASTGVDGSVAFTGPVANGQWIRRTGEDLQKGQLLLPAGTVLGPVQVGLLASIGLPMISVWPRLRVGVMVTGSELQTPGQALQPGQIYNSNEYVWVGLLKGLGVDVVSLGIVKDKRQATIDALTSLLDCDLVISSGGVSVGEEDHVRPAVESLGVLESWKVAMKPGKPLAFGHLRRSTGQPCWFFGLPGNPVSSALAFLLVVKPFIEMMKGRSLAQADWRSRLQSKPAQFDWPQADVRRIEFLRVKAQSQGLQLYRSQSSGVLSALDQSTGLAMLEKGQTVSPGDVLPYVSFQDLMS